MSYSDYILGVNCGYCEALMAEEDARYGDEINAQFPHGAGLAADDYRRGYLVEDWLPSKWEWREEVDKARYADLSAAWGEPPF